MRHLETIQESTGFMRKLITSLLILCFVAFSAAAQLKGTNSEWRYYGADKAQTKYSQLDQINAQNVGQLKLAWTWDSPEVAQMSSMPSLQASIFESTPLFINGVLYTSTISSQVAALDPTTGKALWTYDPESYKAGRPTNIGFVHRGVAYWTDGKQERIIVGTVDAYLIALDAKTGKPIADFGEGGRIDLTKAIPLAVRSRNYSVSSPPVICRDVVIVGASINDVPFTKEMPRGDIQAFDVRTGKPLWVFHTVPQAGEFGNDTWENESWKYTGNTNVWTLMSADEELGYVYLPTGTPTNDWYGGQRLGDNLFAESVICLEAKTGKRVWHYQTVRHGLWDYDLPAAPVLCDITVKGKKIKALAQITKSGFCFVFDRVTGEPVWPIEERKVAQSGVPGERSAPTQPFPTRPAPFETQGATEENLIDFTPELREEAKQILQKYDHGPLFTPPSEKGTVTLPGWGGGANWWGAAFDPNTKVLYIPSITAPILVKLNKPSGEGANLTYVRSFAQQDMNVAGPRGLPLFKPPYGRITAINLNTGEHVWQAPNGDGSRQRVNEILKGMGVNKDVGPLGAGGSGPLLTKTLLFIAQGAGGRGGRSGGGANFLRAFDKATGKVVAEVELPFIPLGSPMTYMAKGKQYIVLSLGDLRLAALSLP
jgi:quinoprotein glucose dehydrogenase